MSIWFTGDFHLDHINILKYELIRKYNNVDEMNNSLINNYNSLIRKNDLVFFLGDFSLTSKDKVTEFRNRMNGRINFICLSSDTKIYIKDKGFIHYNKIEIGDEVLGILDKNIIKYHKILNKQELYYDGIMYEGISKKITKMKITPDHFICYQTKRNKKIKYIKASEFLKNNNTVINIPEAGFLNIDKKYININQIKLVAWIITEGTINKFNQVQIYQNDGIKLERIKSILKKLDLKFSIYTGKLEKNKVIYIHKNYRLLNIINKFLSKGKFNIEYLINNLNYKQLKLFLNEFCLGDGHKNKNINNESMILYTSKENLANQLAIAGIICGYKCRIRSRIKFIWNKSFICYEISLSESLSRCLYSNSIKKVYYKDLVFDLTTEIGNFLVERGGSIFFTGNCGNHDISKTALKESGFEITDKISNADHYIYKNMVLSHYPLTGIKNKIITFYGQNYWDRNCENKWNIHAHSHSNAKQIDYIKKTICVSVEQWNFYPVNFKDIEKLINEN